MKEFLEIAVVFVLVFSCAVLVPVGRACAEGRPVAVFETNMGTFGIELFTDLAPKTAQNSSIWQRRASTTA